MVFLICGVLTLAHCVPSRHEVLLWQQKSHPENADTARPAFSAQKNKKEQGIQVASMKGQPSKQLATVTALAAVPAAVRELSEPVHVCGCKMCAPEQELSRCIPVTLKGGILYCERVKVQVTAEGDGPSPYSDVPIWESLPDFRFLQAE